MAEGTAFTANLERQFPSGGEMRVIQMFCFHENFWQPLLEHGVNESKFASAAGGSTLPAASGREAAIVVTSTSVEVVFISN